MRTAIRLVCLCMAIVWPQARAATFIINSTFDYPNVNPGDGLALDVNGRTTLRAAIEEANALPGPDEIFFGSPFVNPESRGSIQWGQAVVRTAIVISDDLFLHAGSEGRGYITPAGSEEFRVLEVMPGVKLEMFSIYIEEREPLVQNMVADRGAAMYIHPGADVTLYHCGIRHGVATERGGGVYVDHANLYCYYSYVDGFSGGDGGGIYNDHGMVRFQSGRYLRGEAVARGGALYNHGGTVQWINSFSDDLFDGIAGEVGGGIYSDGGTLVMENVNVSRNRAPLGAAVYLTGGATMEAFTVSFTRNEAAVQGGVVYLESGAFRATQCTFGRNTAVFGGGGIYLQGGSASLLNCTVTENEGGLFVAEGALCTLGNTIVAGNSAHGQGGGTDVFGTVVSLGHNLIGVSDGSDGYTGTDLLGTAGMPLDPGITYSISHEGKPQSPFDLWLLDAGSPAIDAGDTSLLFRSDYTGSPCFDTRLSCCPRVRGASVDIGAIEYQEGEVGLTCDGMHSADYDEDGRIGLGELLRLIQLHNAGTFHCAAFTEDGFLPSAGPQDCVPHSSDYNPQDWQIDLNELLRAIQFYNTGGYTHCPESATEDGFLPGQNVGCVE